MACSLYLKNSKYLHSNPLSQTLASPVGWFIIPVNKFYISKIIFPCFILNISYSWIKELSLSLFIYVIFSCVTSKVSYISLAPLHREIEKNLLRFDAEVMILMLSLFILSRSPHFFFLLLYHLQHINHWL